MEFIYWLLLFLCTGLGIGLGMIHCPSRKWLSAFMFFLAAYVALIILDSQGFRISPALYFLLLSICFLPGPLILGYIGHISTRVEVGTKDFILCSLPIVIVLLCNDLLGGHSLWEIVDKTPYRKENYMTMFNLVSAMAGIHILTYLGKSILLIVQMRRDWASYQSQTLPDTWYDMVKVLLVILIGSMMQVISAFQNPSGQVASIGDIGFITIVWYFIFLALRTTLRNLKRENINAPVILEAKDYLSPAPQETITDYTAYGDHIDSTMAQDKLFLKEDLSLSSLADSLNMTPHRLSEVLNKHFKKSFYEFVNDLRIQFAANELISEPDKSITEIFYGAGFTSKSTFYSYFKKTFGCTPSEYRKVKPNSASDS